MTDSTNRTATTAPPIPRPRDAGPDLPPSGQVPARVTTDVTPELPPVRFPWPEPWGSVRGARPRTEYWDVETASWRSRGRRTRQTD